MTSERQACGRVHPGLCAWVDAKTRWPGLSEVPDEEPDEVRPVVPVEAFAEVMAKAMDANPNAWERDEDGSFRSGTGSVAASLRMAHLSAAHSVLATGVVNLPILSTPKEGELDPRTPAKTTDLGMEKVMQEREARLRAQAESTRKRVEAPMNDNAADCVRTTRREGVDHA